MEVNVFKYKNCLAHINTAHLRSGLFNTEAGMEKIGSSQILAASFFFLVLQK